MIKVEIFVKFKNSHKNSLLHQKKDVICKIFRTKCCSKMKKSRFFMSCKFCKILRFSGKSDKQVEKVNYNWPFKGYHGDSVTQDDTPEVVGTSAHPDVFPVLNIKPKLQRSSSRVTKTPELLRNNEGTNFAPSFTPHSGNDKWTASRRISLCCYWFISNQTGHKKRFLTVRPAG